MRRALIGSVIAVIALGHSHATPGGVDQASAAPLSPSASPQSESRPWVAYNWISNAHDGDGLFLMHLDGTDSHEVVPSLPGEPQHPDWSPDGAHIALEVFDGSTSAIWVVDADGSNPRKIVGEGAYPAWSKDGTRMAYVAANGISALALDGGETVKVANIAAPSYAYYPRWSGDDMYVAFSVEHEDDSGITSSAITVARSDGSEADAPRTLTDGALFGSYPDWSPTANLIVFNSYDLSAFQESAHASNLYTVTPDGSILAQLTNETDGGTRMTQPTWTPDGSMIVATRVDCGSAVCENRHMALVSPAGEIVSVVSSVAATHSRLQPIKDETSASATP